MKMMMIVNGIIILLISCFCSSYNNYNRLYFRTYNYNRLYSTTTNKNDIQYRINSIVDPKTIISIRLRHIAVLNEDLVSLSL